MLSWYLELMYVYFRTHWLGKSRDFLKGCLGMGDRIILYLVWDVPWLWVMP
jgi:hypothetical protein